MEVQKETIHYFLIALALLIGLLFGSFYTALSDRILYYFYGKGRKLPSKWDLIFFKPSFCMNCGRDINRIHLIPVLGFFLTGGKCSFCRTPIGAHRLLGEIYPGILLASLVALNENWAFSFLTVLFVGHLYISISTDWNFFMLDYENSIFLYIFGIPAVIFKHGIGETALFHLYTAVFVFFILFILFAAGKGRKFGMGDLIMAPALAFYLGPLLSIILFQLAASMSIIYILFIQKDRKAPSPFGTFMGISLFIIIAADIGMELLNAEVFKIN